MNKRWTEQKYVIHFLLSVMVLGVCVGVSYGLACCQTKGPRDKEAGLVKAVGEVDERYTAYRASDQRVIEIGLLACSEDGVGDIATVDMGNAGSMDAGCGALFTVEDGAEQPSGVEGHAETVQETEIMHSEAAQETGIIHPEGVQEAEFMQPEAAQDLAHADIENAAAQNNGNTQSGQGAASADAEEAQSAQALQTPQDGGTAETSPEQESADTETIGQAIVVSAEDYEALLRIVQAEAGNEDTKGKILVANVVLNRVADDRFPDTVYDVVFQRSGGKAQFSPIASGSYYKVVVSDDTRDAVDRALAGEDYSEGALFFAARRYAGSSQMRWFDECLTKLFSYGGHEFFTR